MTRTTRRWSDPWLPALIADAPLSAARQFTASGDFLFRAGDPDDLARHLDLLVEHPERIRAARQVCLARRGEFSFEESVRRMEEVYLRAARRSAPPAPGA